MLRNFVKIGAVASRQRQWSNATNLAQLARPLSTTQHVLAPEKKVVVVLSGCGVYDGTEVHEAAAILAALTRHGAEPIFYAPMAPQAHVVNHQTGEEMKKDQRSALLESARIARSVVAPLSDLKASDSQIKAVVFPGGFGAAKNLCNFGFKVLLSKNIISNLE